MVSTIAHLIKLSFSHLAAGGADPAADAAAWSWFWSWV